MKLVDNDKAFRMTKNESKKMSLELFVCHKMSLESFVCHKMSLESFVCMSLESFVSILILINGEHFSRGVGRAWVFCGWLSHCYSHGVQQHDRSSNTSRPPIFKKAETAETSPKPFSLMSAIDIDLLISIRRAESDTDLRMWPLPDPRGI